MKTGDVVALKSEGSHFPLLMTVDGATCGELISCIYFFKGTLTRVEISKDCLEIRDT